VIEKNCQNRRNCQRLPKLENQALQHGGNDQPEENSDDFISIKFYSCASLGSATLSAIFGNFGTSGNCLIRAKSVNPR